MKKAKQHILLKDKGRHQHTLYGDFEISEDVGFKKLNVLKESVLVHEHPNGELGNHFTLKIRPGRWSMGRQVRYNPFDDSSSDICD